ncbi:carboxypeptidase-like regulatory domain-containing protein [Marinifilum sp. D737]|uniref:carboxypeptidase-like regulatory domain-containing protein n=1 Tax=Marinifilum sp. D737 TaxID=2969628 RepID=UPI002276D38C|nr:carboxypeptidase-like regulatory domain-containing protein [Marinifilum sp. D737]MCY1635373.1 carboxypeptidase-like regulatory domain-containing protein [Marinifilum sp. D737]
MNKPIYIAFLLLNLLSSTANAQIQVNSKVVDKESGKAIPFANISIANTTKGSMSNQEGDFQLYIPLSGLNTRVLISSLGYKSISIHPKEIGKTIELSPVSYGISEVKISANKLMNDPKKILKECMKAAPGFRPDQPYINKGFMRQTHLLNKKYVKLIEAALFTYSTPNEKASKVHILEKRNSYDNREIDAKKLGFFKKWESTRYNKAKREAENYNPGKEELLELIRESDEKRNSVRKIKQLKTAYQAKIKDLRLSLNDIYNDKNSQLKLDTILENDGEGIYKIKILPTAKELKSSPFISIGYLLISTKDFALYELKYGMTKNPKIANLQQVAFINLVKSNFTLKYKRYKGKLYPSYFKRNSFDLTGMSDVKIHLEKAKYPRICQEFLFTEIIDNTKEVKQNLPAKWNDKLYEDSEYHPEFWENYTILLETKDEAKLRKDLESEVSLKEQYQHATDSIRINQIN